MLDDVRRGDLPIKIEVLPAASSVPPPPHAGGPQYQLWHDEHGTVIAYAHSRDEWNWLHLPGVASFRFNSATELQVTPHPNTSDETIRDALYRTVIPLVLQSSGVEVLHASAVLGSRGVIALCAVSGTGKSTIAYGLSRRGFPLVADDAVVFRSLDQGIGVDQFPFGIRLLPDAHMYFRSDQLADGEATRPPCSKPAFSVPPPLEAVIILERSRSALPAGLQPTARHLPPAEAFKRTLMHAYFYDLHSVDQMRAMMNHYMDLVTSVPVIELRFSPGLRQLQELLEYIESTLILKP